MDLQKGILYGPLQSRRLGRSLGINILPNSFKLCSMNCCYCQYGWTHQTYDDGQKFSEIMPSPGEVEAAVVGALDDSVDFDYLTVCGNGEPTLHPQFDEIVESVCNLRQKNAKDFGVAVISNSTTCFLPATKSALNRVDLAVMKLDAGNERMFKRLNGKTTSTPFDSILAGLKKLNKYIVQTMFVKGAINNSSDSEVNSWLERLQNLNPQCVQVYSLARSAASEKIERVEKSRLEEIAELGRLETGFVFDVF